MVKLYSDEDFSFPVVEELRRLGHDVLTAQEAGQGSLIWLDRSSPRRRFFESAWGWRRSETVSSPRPSPGTSEASGSLTLGLRLVPLLVRKTSSGRGPKRPVASDFVTT